MKERLCDDNGITFNDVLVINPLCLFQGEMCYVLDQGRVESALGNQYQPYERHELAFASVYKSLVINHGFMNGNKRTAVIVLYLASIILNNELKISDYDLMVLTYQLASPNGSGVSVESIADKVFKHHSTSSYLNDSIDVNVVYKYIDNHRWLMRELGRWDTFETM